MKRLCLLAVVLVALVLRLSNAVFVPGQESDLIVSDMKGYNRAALALLKHEPLAVHTAERYLFHPLGSDTYHPPGYYYFLAGIYALFGHRYLAVRLMQSLLDTLTVVLVFSTGRNAFGDAVGLLVAALAAVYPPLIFYTGVLLTETMTTFLLASAVWLLLLATSSPARSRLAMLALSGLVLGLVVITRSAFLTSLPLILLWVVLIARGWHGWRAAAQQTLAFLLPVVMTIAPVTIRNYQIHHQFIMISTNGGVNFFLGHGGNERLKNEVRGLPDQWSEGDIVGISSLTQPEEEARFYQLGWEYLRGHLLPSLRSLPGKLADMYWASEYWPASDAQARVLRLVDSLVWRAAVVPLSAASLLLWRGEGRRRAALLVLVILSTATIPLVFWAQTRFRIPVVPFFMILAVGTVVELYRRLRRQDTLNMERIST